MYSSEALADIHRHFNFLTTLVNQINILNAVKTPHARIKKKKINHSKYSGSKQRKFLTDSYSCAWFTQLVYIKPDIESSLIT